jgi:hypothetical protein
MKKLLFSGLLSLYLIAPLSAQVNPSADEEKNMKTLAQVDSGWTKKGSVTVGVTGSYFSQWAAGGINSLGINSLLNYNVNYRKGKNAWDNTFIAAFGMMNQGFTTKASWIKTDDRLDITSKYGRSIKKKIFLAGLLNFNTQFAAGYAPGTNGLPDRTKLISNLMAPGRVLASIGLDYKPKPELSIFMSPITYRGIYVFDDMLAAQGAFGVEKGEIRIDTLEDGSLKDVIVKNGASARHEVGAYLRVNYVKKFTDNFNVTSRLELFSNYLDKPQNVDLSWETIAALKLGKYFSLTTSVNLLYDDNTIIVKQKETSQTIGDVTVTTTENYNSKGLQTRIISTLGLTYNF